MQWDKTLTRIAEQVSEEEGVSVPKVKTAVETFFKLLRKAIDKRFYVRIENFGVIYPNHDVIYYKVNNIIKRYRKDGDKQKFNKDFNKWWRILELARKNSPRKGKKDWRKDKG